MRQVWQTNINMKLIQLPTGQWIDPQTVTAIVPLGRLKFAHAPCVVVHAGGATTIINCDDFEQAQQIANELAGRVNMPPNDQALPQGGAKETHE